MKLDKKSLLLYAVTDRTWSKKTTLKEQTRQALEGGVTMLQLREKNADFEEFVSTAKEIGTLVKKYNIPFIINDNVNVASAVNADGVHIGQSDEKLFEVRKRLGTDKIIGVSVQNVSQAVKAEQESADYLGVGAVFSTSTKKDAENVPVQTIMEICQSVNIPVVAIGGIDESNILKLRGLGLAGVAVVSAIYAKTDIKSSAQRLLDLSTKMIGEEK